LFLHKINNGRFDHWWINVYIDLFSVMCVKYKIYIHSRYFILVLFIIITKLWLCCFWKLNYSSPFHFCTELTLFSQYSRFHFEILWMHYLSLVPSPIIIIIIIIIHSQSKFGKYVLNDWVCSEYICFVSSYRRMNPYV
jgi:hypothetical protein